jgi:hypothetical protein
MIRNLVIADPGLISENGHHFHVSMKYAAAGQELGLSVKVLAHIAYAPELPDPLIVHAFSYNLYDSPRWLRPKIARTLVGPTISTVVKDLMRVGPSVPLTEETLVYFHSCSLSLVNDLLDYFLVAPDEATPCFMLRLIYENDPSGCTYPHWYLNQLRKKLRFSGMAGRKLFLSAETEALANQMASILEVPCERIHHLATNLDTGARAGVVSPTHLSLAFLGDARREKGFQLLPEVAKAVAGDSALAAACELVVQAKASAVDHSEIETTDAVKSELLELSQRMRISFVDSRLDDQLYNGLVNETDIALLLHDPAVYRTRGSAIYYDAALTGKCMIVREGSSMASESDVAGIVVWKRNERFIDALRRAIELHGKLAAGTLDSGAAELRAKCDPRAILKHLMATMDRRLQGPPPPIAVQVLPAWFGEGSSHVFQAQTGYLAGRGFRVVDVVVVTWDGAGEPEPEFYERIFEGTQRHDTFYTFYIQRPPEPAAAERTSLSASSYSLLSFAYEAKWLLDAELPAGLIRMVGAHKPELSLINYAQYMPARGFLGDGKAVLEMHDLRSRQYAIERGSDVLEARDIAQEVSLALAADGIVFINEREKATFEKHCGKPFNGAAAFPVMDDHGAGNSERRDLLETVFAASDDQCAALDAFAWSNEAKGARLMFVASAHVSNTMSLDWFLAEVFLPHLHPLGLTLHVFGSIAKRYRQAMPGVVFHGRVEHIQPLYRFADIVVLPIRVGSGLPIKGLDAVRAGVPLVATSKAFEGVASALDYLGFFDDPAAFANEVVRLAQDSAARSHVAQQVKRMAADVIDPKHYSSVWDGVIEQAGVRLPGSALRAPLCGDDLDALRMARLFPDWKDVRALLSSFTVLDQFMKLEFAAHETARPVCLTIRSDAPPLKLVTRVADGPARLYTSDAGVASILVLPELGRLPALELFAAGKNNFAWTSRLEMGFSRPAGSRALLPLQPGSASPKTAQRSSDAGHAKPAVQPVTPRKRASSVS